MSVARSLRLAVEEGGPRVLLLEAGSSEPDEASLRQAARLIADGLRARHTSRSYRFPYALIAGHDRAVGVDIERSEPPDESFLESICTPSERRVLAGDSAQVDVSSLWCSKEALAKALGDALRYDPRRLESPQMWPNGRSGPWRAQQLAAPAGHVAWVCWRSSPAAA